MSAMYFPDRVDDDKSYDIDYEVLLQPIMSGGENYKVSAGSGHGCNKVR